MYIYVNKEQAENAEFKELVNDHVLITGALEVNNFDKKAFPMFIIADKIVAYEEVSH